MNTERIFEGKSCTADYMPQRNTVFFTLIGYVKVDEHKEMYLKILKFTETHPVEAFIHDFGQLKGTFTQLNDWLIQTLRPCLERGLKIQCLVMNNDAFTMFASKDVMKKSALHTQIFKTREEAEKYIDDRLMQAAS